MPVPREYEEVLDLLCEATRDGRVNWRRHSNRSYIVMDTFSLWIWREKDGESGSHKSKSFSKSDDSGQVFIQMDNKNDRLMDIWMVSADDADFEKVYGLSCMADRISRGVIGRLEELRTRLSDKSAQVGIPRPPKNTCEGEDSDGSTEVFRL